MQRVHIVWLTLQYFRVILDRLFILPKSRQAVGSIIQCLCVAPSKLHLIAIIIDRILIPLQLPPHQASICIDYWVVTIQSQCFIEVIDSLGIAAHVPHTARSVVPIYCVFLVQVDGGCEVL